MEHILGANDFKLNVVVNALSCTAQKSLPNFDKRCCLVLVNLKEKKYAVCKASNLSATKARRLYGFENMGETFSKVEEAIVETESIREAIDELASVEDRAMLASFGNPSSDSDVDIPHELESSDFLPCEVSSETRTNIICALKENQCNWFAAIEALQSVAESDEVEVISQKVFSELTHTDCDLFSSSEKILLKESKEAVDCADRDGYDEDRIARALNNEIVTDSESDNPDSYFGMKNILSENGKQLIQRKRRTIRRRAQRLMSKTVAERRFLSRRVSPRVSKIEKKCPNIGTVVEEFVQKANVGADAYRCVDLRWQC